MSGLDKLVRELPKADAVGKYDTFLNQVQTLRKEEKEIPRPLYMKYLQYCAKRVLLKLEEREYSKECWLTYCEFFTSAMLSYGTSEMNSMLDYSEKIVYSVLQYHSQTQPLLKEYLRCSVAQEEQRNRDLAELAAKPVNNIDCPAPLEQPPEIEKDGHITAVAPPYPVETVTKVLNRLPTHVTFPHTNGLLHMKLLNPLPIPDCPFVSSGYACDSCGLRGIKVAFEAMLYEEDEEVKTGAVRSNARIAQHYSHGYDMCIACVVYFYLKQEQQLKRAWMKPYEEFAVGVSSGVSIKEAVYVAGGAIVKTRKKPSQSLSPPTHSPPPSNPPSRKSSGVSCNAEGPQPPPTRCTVTTSAYVEVEVGIAPIGARPIAFILPGTEEPTSAPLQPPPGWSDRCQIVSQEGAADAEGEGSLCMICLESLSGMAPVIQTTCHHSFHVECIVGYIRTAARRDNVCPICRTADPLPDRSLHHSLETNVFKVRVALLPKEAEQRSVRVFVGVLLSRHFTYDNLTNVAAGRSLTLKPNEQKILERRRKSPS